MNKNQPKIENKNPLEFDIETKFHFEAFKRSLNDVTDEDILRDLTARAYNMYLKERQCYRKLKKIDDNLIATYKKLNRSYVTYVIVVSILFLLLLFTLWFNA